MMDTFQLRKGRKKACVCVKRNFVCERVFMRERERERAWVAWRKTKRLFVREECD